MILKRYCPECKVAVKQVVSERYLTGILFRTYQCGHEDPYPQLSPASFLDFTSRDGKKPYKFQIEGALFAIESGARCLNTDEMGLGKTVQGLMPIWAHRRELSPVWIQCKAGLKAQWQKEFTRWLGEDYMAQIVNKGTDPILPGVRGIITSFDTTWRFKDIPAFIQRCKIKSIIIDEVQHIKNGASQRTKGLQIACAEVTHVIALSGMPIKNHAGEYFPILNILRPDLFPTKSYFEQVWVDTYWDGKKLVKGGLKNPAKFQEYTKKFIIRRTREQVMPDLPKITRDFRYSELGPVVEEAYKDTLKEFQNYFNNQAAYDSAITKSSNIMAYLARMRHLTGIAKIESVLDYVEDFMTSTDRKLVIFAHHKDVGKVLYEKLEELRQAAPDTWGRGILNIQGINADSRAPVVEQFENPDFRILIAGELSSGEGLNLQFCSDCVLMERQWNPANEEQAEARFIRIGQKATSVSAMYPIAIGTVDEFLAELVEKKRGVCSNVVDGKEYIWNESSIITELAEILASQGGRKWGW